MDGNIRRLIPLACLLGAVTVAGCSGEVSGEPEGVLGVREGGQGTILGAGDGNVEAFCRTLLSCVPAEAASAGVTVDECVSQFGPYFNDLFVGAPAGCEEAFNVYFGCIVDNLQCDGEGFADPGDACAAEEPAVATACAGFEPDVNIEDYIQVEQTYDDRTSSENL